jgi:hypothetical protein
MVLNGRAHQTATAKYLYKTRARIARRKRVALPAAGSGRTRATNARRHVHVAQTPLRWHRALRQATGVTLARHFAAYVQSSSARRRRADSGRRRDPYALRATLGIASP